MLNLVISYSFEGVVVNEREKRVDHILEECHEDLFCVLDLDLISREKRNEYFEKIQKVDKQIREYLKDYFKEVNEDFPSNDSKYVKYVVEEAKIQTRLLTDQDMIILDAKMISEGKRPLENQTEFDYLAQKIIKIVGKKVDKGFHKELESPTRKDYPTPFAIWAQVHEEFKNAPTKEEYDRQKASQRKQETECNCIDENMGF